MTTYELDTLDALLAKGARMTEGEVNCYIHLRDCLIHALLASARREARLEVLLLETQPLVPFCVGTKRLHEDIAKELKP